MIDFFHEKWLTEPALTEQRWGIMDNGTVSYTVTAGDEKQWDAIVRNPDGRTVLFVPIDHHVLVMEDKGERSMCDGMLYTAEHDYVSFIELKNRGSQWMEEAISQLESTVQVFIENHEDTAKGNRYAYACNHRHPQFAFSKKERMQHFYNKYHFRLFIQKDVLVK